MTDLVIAKKRLTNRLIYVAPNQGYAPAMALVDQSGAHTATAANPLRVENKSAETFDAILLQLRILNAYHAELHGTEITEEDLA